MCLVLLRVLKDCHQCRSSPAVLPILYFTGQFWVGALLGRFVRALRWVQGTIFYLGCLVGFDEGGRWVVSLLY